MSAVEAAKTGGCLCGTVRYTVRGRLRDVILCHCERCQRQHSYVGAYTACAPEALDVSGGRSLRWYRSSPDARRGFCSRCGTQLFWEPAHRGHISVSAGSLDPPTGLTVEQHICVAQKGDYYEITDALPQRP